MRFKARTRTECRHPLLVGYLDLPWVRTQG